MKGLAVDDLEVTTLDQKELGAKTKFTHKSGTKPLPGYTIKRGIGWGGFGEVYYAISDGGKEVALKLVQRHLEVELRGISHCLNLKHPHLVSLYDVIQNDKGESWVVMEYLAGQSLQDRLEAANGAIKFEECVHWLNGIARAVDFLHEQGIVHRDLKPGNVFSENDIVKVGDYGLSKFISASRRSGQTQSVGTVHYMAPEISTGNYGKSVDIYAAAVMAYEMLTGDVPFDGETAGEVLMKHLTAEPNLSRIDAQFRPIFAKALAKDPAHRFGSVAELVAAILAVARGDKPDASEQLAPTPSPKVLAGPQIPVDLKHSLPPVPGTFKARRRAFSDVLWSLFLAGVLSGLLPILALTAWLVLADQQPQLNQYITLSVVTGISSWGLLLLGRFWEHERSEPATRRFSSFVFGLVMAVVVFGMNVWLDRPMGQLQPDMVTSAQFSEETFQQIAPVALVYASLFGLIFAIPDWARSVCSGRKGRFSGWRAIWPGAASVLLATLTGVDEKGLDPMWMGAVVVMTAVIVQWVSPYLETKKRHRFAGHP